MLTMHCVGSEHKKKIVVNNGSLEENMGQTTKPRCDKISTFMKNAPSIWASPIFFGGGGGVHVWFGHF